MVVALAVPVFLLMAGFALRDEVAFCYVGLRIVSVAPVAWGALFVVFYVYLYIIFDLVSLIIIVFIYRPT